LLDAMTDTFATVRAHLTPDDAALFERLRSLEADIGHRTLAGPPAGVSVADLRSELDALGEQASALEAQIAARSADFRVATEPVTIEKVQRAIPANAVLVEIAAYKPFDPKAGPPRYAAYALRVDGAIAYADLGDAASIDALVARLRAKLADQASDPEPLARALDERVGRPMRAIAGDADSPGPRKRGTRSLRSCREPSICRVAPRRSAPSPAYAPRACCTSQPTASSSRTGPEPRRATVAARPSTKTRAPRHRSSTIRSCAPASPSPA
jgi:hypothetical protein